MSMKCLSIYFEENYFQSENCEQMNYWASQGISLPLMVFASFLERRRILQPVLH